MRAVADPDRAQHVARRRGDHGDRVAEAVRRPQRGTVGGDLQHVGRPTHMPLRHLPPGPEADHRDAPLDPVAHVQEPTVPAYGESVGPYPRADERDLPEVDGIDDGDAGEALVRHVEHLSVGRHLDVDGAPSHLDRPGDGHGLRAHPHHDAAVLAAHQEIGPVRGEVHVVGPRPGDLHLLEELPGVGVAELDELVVLGDHDGFGPVGGEVQVVRACHRDAPEDPSGARVDDLEPVAPRVVHVQMLEVPRRGDVVGLAAHAQLPHDPIRCRIDHVHGPVQRVRHVHPLGNPPHGGAEVLRSVRRVHGAEGRKRQCVAVTRRGRGGTLRCGGRARSGWRGRRCRCPSRDGVMFGGIGTLSNLAGQGGTHAQNVEHNQRDQRHPPGGEAEIAVHVSARGHVRGSYPGTGL